MGDWIHAGDVAEAIARLLRATATASLTYNVAYGRAETIEELVKIIEPKRTRINHRFSSKQEANVICDPDRRHGQWGAYDISRLCDELDWEPAPAAPAHA